MDKNCPMMNPYDVKTSNNENLGDILNMVMTPKVDAMVNDIPISDWVYHALNGEKINAIIALRAQVKVYAGIEGQYINMSLSLAKDIVESIIKR